MLGDELLDVIHRYPDHVWVFLHEFPALTDERAEQFRTRRREYERRVEAVLQAGIDAGEFRDVDPWLTARAWLGMHNYTYLWLKAGGRCSARDVAKPFADIFLRGIARVARARSATGASKPRRPPRVPPIMAAFSSSGTSRELPGDQLPAAAERALGVRVVVAPHDARHAGDVPARDRDRVVLERHVELALHVLARRQRVGPLVVEAEQLRHVRLVGGRRVSSQMPEPPVGVLADAGDPALVHRADQRRRASAR